MEGKRAGLGVGGALIQVSTEFSVQIHGGADAEFKGAQSLLFAAGNCISATFGCIDVFLFAAAGSSDPERPYQKLVAVQHWLLGYECPDSVLLFSRDADGSAYTCIIMASRTKLDVFRPFGVKPDDIDVPLTVTFVERDKKNAGNADQYKPIFENCRVRCREFDRGASWRAYLVRRVCRVLLARYLTS
jgi:hypothetical protein